MLGLFKLDAHKIVGKALDAVEPITPKQYRYAMHTRDLRNVTPAGFVFDNEGRRLAGRFTPADITDGSPSPSIWILFPPSVIVAFLGFVMLALAAFWATYIPAAAYGSAYTSSLANGNGFILSSIVALWSTYKGIFVLNAIAAIPLAILSYLTYIVVSETEPTRAAHHYFWIGALGYMAGVVILPVVGPIAGALACLAMPWLVYYLHIKGLAMARHQALIESSEEAKGMTALPDARQQEGLRARQCEAALKDFVPVYGGLPGQLKPAPLVILGIDTGWVREETNNSLSADKGAPVGISLGDDLSKHMFVFGSTGSGKTSGFLKPIAKAWAENDMGGGLYIDAKAGALAIELHAAGLIDEVLHPSSLRGLKANICAGVNPVFFAKAMGDVFSTDSGEDSVFDKAARIYIMAAASIVQFASANNMPGVALNFAYIDRFRSDRMERERVLNQLLVDYSDEIMRNPALKSNFDQWANAYPNLPNETRGSVDFTLDTYFKEIVSNEAISDCLSGDGVDLAELICSGKRIGLVLSEQDGKGGVLALSIIKAAVFAKLKSRAQDPAWRDKGGRDVLFMVDECASLLGELDSHAASVLRSLGARMVYACQSYSQIVSKLGGNDQANAMLGNFKTVLTLNAEGAGDIGAMTGTYAYISERVGNLFRLDKNDTQIEALALDKGVQKIRASGIENRRYGAIRAKLSSLSTMVAEVRSAMSISPQSLGETKDQMRLAGSESYQLRLMPAITANELTFLCNGTHKAAGRIERGGVGRTVVLDVRPGIAETEDARTVMLFRERVAALKNEKNRVKQT